MSRKLVTFKPWSTVILSPYFLNSAISAFAMRLAWQADLFRRMAKPSSRYRPTSDSLLNRCLILCRRYVPTSSHVSAPS